MMRFSCEESEFRLSQIIEAAPIAMFVLRGDHTITHWNKGCVDLFGYPAEEMIGSRDAWRAFYLSPRPVLANLVLDGASLDVVRSFYGEKVQLWPTVNSGWQGIDSLLGGSRRLSFAAAPLLDLDGRVAGAVETIVEIAENRQSLVVEQDLSVL